MWRWVGTLKGWDYPVHPVARPAPHTHRDCAPRLTSTLTPLQPCTLPTHPIHRCSTGPFTVLAPVNTGFEKLGRNILDFVFSPHNKAALDNILTYHVISGSVPSSALTNGEVVPTLDAKETITVGVAGSKVSFNNGAANVLIANVAASNGIIHVVRSICERGWGGVGGLAW